MEAMTRTRGILALCAVALMATSCSIFQSVAEAPGRLLGILAPSPDGKSTIDLEVVRNEGLRFADRMVSRIDIATRIFANRLDTPEAAERALSWRLSTADRAYQTAAQSRPIAALSDLLALCIYERSVHRLYWSKRYGEEADEPMLAVWNSLVEEGIETVNRLLSKDLSQAVGRVIARWDETATDTEQLQRAGPPRFEDLVSKDLDPKETVTIFGALGLDPLDSIEPAAREIARTRELGERAVYLAQRAPRTLAWRAELLALQLTQQADIHAVVESVERTSKAFESVSETVAALPEQLRIEGQALVQDISKAAAEQRAGLAADLERTAPSTQALLTTAEKTLDAGTRTAQAVESMAHAFRGSTAEGEGQGLKDESSPGKPFDPVEYTALAAQTTLVLEQLNTAVARLDTSLPVVQRTMDDAASRVDQSVDRALNSLLKVVLMTIAAVVVAIVVLRFVPSRRRRDVAD